MSFNPFSRNDWKILARCAQLVRTNPLLKIKNPEGHGKRPTQAESEFMECWQGQVEIVEDNNSALALLNH
jgi:hypothetical protein